MENKKKEELIKEINNIELPLSDIKVDSKKNEEEEKEINKNFILASLLFLSFFFLILLMGILE